MTSSHNLLQSTVARNLDANKNEPLNFLQFNKGMKSALIGEKRPANPPVEGVRFPRWWCETMIQHDGDALPDVSGDTSPR